MAIATTIDLSKIPAKELPTSTVKAAFSKELGEQEYEIRALDDISLQDWGDVTSDPQEIFRNSKTCLIALTNGLVCLGGDKAKALYLLKNASSDEVVKVVAAIISLTNELDARKAEEKKTAEKN